MAKTSPLTIGSAQKYALNYFTLVPAKQQWWLA